MKILLVDADSKVPNIAIMKLSAFHKSKGDVVRFVRAGIHYFPTRRKHITLMASGYDTVYVSAIFFNTLDYLHFSFVSKHTTFVYGGTGSKDITKRLPAKVENAGCDYSLYPNNKSSWGFLTRGCIRNCSFCIVRQKEGCIRLDQKIDDIVKPFHNSTEFLDNNILAHPAHKEILKELVERHIQCRFSQGLDARLLTDESAELLCGMNYKKEYIFAFDDLANEKDALKAINLMRRYLTGSADWRCRFYVYIHPDMNFEKDILYRLNWCRKNRALAYAMRDIACWGGANGDKIAKAAFWANYPPFFKSLSFEEFYALKNDALVESAKQYGFGLISN